MKATNIIWDADIDILKEDIQDLEEKIQELQLELKETNEALEAAQSLPTELEFPDELFDGGYDDEVADYLSEQTGYCVESFNIEGE